MSEWVGGMCHTRPSVQWMILVFHTSRSICCSLILSCTRNIIKLHIMNSAVEVPTFRHVQLHVHVYTTYFTVYTNIHVGGPIHMKCEGMLYLIDRTCS